MDSTMIDKADGKIYYYLDSARYFLFILALVFYRIMAQNFYKDTT